MIKITNRDDHDGYRIDIDGQTEVIVTNGKTEVVVTWDQAKRLRDGLAEKLASSRDPIRAARDRWSKVVRNKFVNQTDTGKIIAFHASVEDGIILKWKVGATLMQYTPDQFVGSLKESDRERAKQWVDQHMP